MARCPLFLVLALTLLVSTTPAAAAEPYVPTDESDVLAQLPEPQGNVLRQRLARQPKTLSLALELARGYVSAARATGDPRYNGYAQAALKPWWRLDTPPVEVLILRATLHQNRHAFDAALADLDQVLVRRPGHPQALLTRAVILQVQGRTREAAASCRRLAGRVRPLIAIACLAEAASLSGRAEAAYVLLEKAYRQDGAGASPDVRLWALTVLAEMAQRLGRSSAAEDHFRAALELGRPDTYLTGAYGDFLLEHNRPDEVLALIPEAPQPDGLLLRRALAEQALGLPRAAQSIAALTDRFAASRRRGDSVHQRDEARFHLFLTGQAGRALDLTLSTWRVQREPWDARLVLEAALAAGRPEAAHGVLAWLDENGLEDWRLAALTARFQEATP